MDPQTAFNDIVGGTDPDDIRDSANALYDWIIRGGFRPKAINSNGDPLPAIWSLVVGGIRFKHLFDGTIGVEIV